MQLTSSQRYEAIGNERRASSIDRIDQHPSAQKHPVNSGRPDLVAPIAFASPGALGPIGRLDNEYRHTAASVWHWGI